MSKYRYKREHDELHKIHVLVHSNSQRITEEVHQTRLTELTPRAKVFTTHMCKERKIWMRLITEANAVKKQISELERVIAAERRAFEIAQAEAEDGRAEEEYETVEHEAEDRDTLLKSEAGEE